MTQFRSAKQQKRTHRQGRIPGEIPVSAFSSILTTRQKLGRRTIPDNFLLGSRNEWAALLEESWPEVGWALLSIRDRRNSTIEDVRRAFEPARGRLPIAGMAAAFYRDGFETANASEVAKNRHRVGKLQSELQHTRAKRDEAQWSCREAASALEQVKPGDKDTIQHAVARRQQQLLLLEKNLQTLQGEHDALDRKVQDQEVCVFRSELLDYLLSRRYAVKPRNPPCQHL